MTGSIAADLDDVAAIEAGDPGEMLRAVATSAAQVRSGATAAIEAGVDALAEEGRPRAVVVTGMGGSAMAGDVLAALAAPRSPVPVVVARGFGLPGWVGAADLVVALSCSGSTEETLSAGEEALRRGASVVGIGAAGSPLAHLTDRARGLFVPVTAVHSPRATLWSMATPLVAIGAALGLVDPPADAFEATAERLQGLALRCQPGSESFLNPAKELALSLAGRVPMAWGASAIAGVAAYRLACQWEENAKAPALSGVLPEAAHNQIVTFDGPWVGTARDLFADRVEGEDGSARLHLLLLRDGEEHARVAAQADAARELAIDRGLALTELVADGASPYERLASLVGLIDYASAYLAVLTGVDPTPIATINALKSTLRAGLPL